MPTMIRTGMNEEGRSADALGDTIRYRASVFERPIRCSTKSSLERYRLSIYFWHDRRCTQPTRVSARPRCLADFQMSAVRSVGRRRGLLRYFAEGRHPEGNWRRSHAVEPVQCTALRFGHIWRLKGFSERFPVPLSE